MGEAHYSSFRNQIYALTEESNLNFGDLVAATDKDDMLAKTRQFLRNN